MPDKPITLFVNHLEHNCGVYQFFLKLIKPIIDKLPHYTTYYIETNQEWEFDYWVNHLNPEIIVYNFYFSGTTMPWLNSNVLARNRHRKQIGLHHEGSILDKGFDLVLHQDPTNKDAAYFNLTRPIPNYPLSSRKNVIPTIGSFGFGLGGKGFTRVVQTVIDTFEYASIRLLIPYAHFGDNLGTGAHWWSNACYELIQDKPLYDLSVSHTLLPENELVYWLSENDINCFFYDYNIGRGLSGTVDYALAAKKPIALTKSDQFRHIWTYDDRMLIENHSLIDIIKGGADYLQMYHAMWSNQKLIERFEQAFDLVRGI